MVANFDGMRRNATASMNELHRVLKEGVLGMDSFDISDDLKEKIVEAFNNAAQNVDVMNCLYDDAEESDMNDLSDFLSIERLKIIYCEEVDC